MNQYELYFFVIELLKETSSIINSYLGLDFELNHLKAKMIYLSDRLYNFAEEFVD